MKNNAIIEIERKRVEHIKELLLIDPLDRDEKTLLQLMSFTKVILFYIYRILNYLKVLQCQMTIKIFVCQ